ncbi:MAG: DUF6650 family protein [Ignavibacteriaceae bacterium]
MKFKEIVKRLNGISTPIFGASWNPSQTDKDQAKEIIVFLEDRRVLYNPSEMEMPNHCVQSVLEIRRFITQKIGTIQLPDLQESLRAMRASCRKFLDSVGIDEDIMKFGHHRGHWASWEFNSAVGELRGVFGIHIARIAVMYGIDVEKDLAKILPAIDSEEPRRKKN